MVDPRMPVATVSQRQGNPKKILERDWPKSDLDSGFTHPMRPNIGTNGKTIPLRANYFKVKIPDTDLHHYDVDIRPDKCPRRVNREIIENMVENFRSRIFQVHFSLLEFAIYESFLTFIQ